MNILELSKKRFSVRKYSDTPVSEEDLQYILEVTRMAPSAVNKQPWKFVVVKSEAARKQLQECYDRDWFKSAPLYVICMREVDTTGYAKKTTSSMAILMLPLLQNIFAWLQQSEA